ncbi:hypothetical protein F5Y19DRAFT_488534 [Xylariaceae sp. FL1651]|nr:hypothetical protein F5Y19DRAFT_488534 [Xylariaceae sp. FL1651]
MSGLASPELANNDHFTRKTETIDPSREAGPATRPGPPGWTQQPWYQPTYYYPQPADLPYGPNYFPPYPQVTTQKGPTGWDGFNPFDEEEQERRKKGKELVPVGPLMNGPPPWTAYPGGYGYMAYGPMGPPFWPALPLPQHPLLPPPPSPTEVGHGSKKVGKHVHHYGQRPGVNQNHNVQDPPLELKINREIDGILTPSSGDLTVHLSMDLQEDLEDQLDELTRLSRLGHFSRAEEFIKESLQHHMDNPYVLVQYADLLLQKGDFKGATLLKDDAIYKYEGDKSNSEDLRILRVNWELMQLLAKSHTLDTLSSATTVFEEAADVLYELARGQPPDKPIASTELTGNPALHSKWLGYGGKALDAFPTSPVQLYPILLRQGRIWDFHDLVVLLPTIEDIRVLIHGISGHDLIPGLQAMIADWSNSIHGYDSSTTLALLSMMTHVLLEPIQASEKECIEILKLCLPLALSILENDPGNLKSRPYLRLLLAKSRFAETASRQANELLTSHLRSSPGVFYQFDIASLPIYVPSGTETPDWILTDQPPELKDPVKLVLNSASNLGDLKTEALALQELIRLSSNPLNEFERLCRLQLSHQGDMNSYGLSLASKYLVSSTKPSRETLAIDISRLLSRVASTDYWSPSHEWILNALLYKLEGRSSATIQHMLERSHADYHNMDEALLQEISRKMPVLKDWVDQQARSAKRARQGNTILPAAARRGNRSSARRGKAPMSQRTGEQLRPGTQKNPSDEAQKERELAVMSTPKPKDSRQNLQYSQPHLPIPNPMPGNMPLPTHTQANNERREDARLVSEIRKKLEAEFDRKIETEKRLMREQRDERKPFLEDLKKEVSAIRKEAIEQAEKKARVEAEERAERLRWERLMEEKKLQKEIEVAKAKAAAAELGAKLAAETEAAMQEAERKLRKELESQHKVRSLFQFPSEASYF